MLRIYNKNAISSTLIWIFFSVLDKVFACAKRNPRSLLSRIYKPSAYFCRALVDPYRAVSPETMAVYRCSRPG